MAKRRQPPQHHSLQVRVSLSNGARVGPGRAELLERIAAEGSISAAARAMDMSYRRAWLLLDALAKEFGAPVVDAKPGGVQGGGASLTPLGQSIAASYRRIEAKARAAAATDLDALAGLIAS